MVLNKEKVPLLFSGDLPIVTSTNNYDYELTLEGILSVPGLTTNL